MKWKDTSSLWDADKALNSYIKKEVRSQISDLNFDLKKLGKKKIKLKVSKRKEVIKIRIGNLWNGSRKTVINGIKVDFLRSI